MEIFCVSKMIDNLEAPQWADFDASHISVDEEYFNKRQLDTPSPWGYNKFTKQFSGMKLQIDDDRENNSPNLSHVEHDGNIYIRTEDKFKNQNEKRNSTDDESNLVEAESPLDLSKHRILGVKKIGEDLPVCSQIEARSTNVASAKDKSEDNILPKETSRLAKSKSSSDVPKRPILNKKKPMAKPLKSRILISKVHRRSKSAPPAAKVPAKVAATLGQPSKKILKKPPTAPATFVQQTNVRKKMPAMIPFTFDMRNIERQDKKKPKDRKQQEDEIKEKKSIFHAKPVPSFVKKTTAIKDSAFARAEESAGNKPCTKLCSLSFQERNELLVQKRKKMVEEAAERESRTRVFHAKPAPKNLRVNVNVRGKNRGLSPTTKQRGLSQDSIFSKKENVASNVSANNSQRPKPKDPLMQLNLKTKKTVKKEWKS